MSLYDLVTKEVVKGSTSPLSEEDITTLTETYKGLHKQILKYTLVKPRAVIDAYLTKYNELDIQDNDIARVFGRSFRVKHIPEVLNLVPFGIVLGYCKRSITWRNRENKVLHDIRQSTNYAPYWYCVYMPDVFFNKVQKYIYLPDVNRPVALTPAAFSHDLPLCTLLDLNLAVGSMGVVKPTKLIRRRRSATTTVHAYMHGLDKFDPYIKRLPGKWAASLPY